MTEVTPWAQFTDFAKFTPSNWLSNVRDRANEFQKHGYIQNYFLPGSEPHKFLRGGANIKTHITLKENRSYGAFDAGELLSLPQTQSGDFATSHWTTGRAALSWNERETLLQFEGMSDSNRGMIFQSVYEEKMGDFMRGVANDIEDEFFAVPTTSMETASGNIPRSLPLMVNECRTAVHTGTAPVADGYWPGISTLGGIDPTDHIISGNKSRWACQQFAYGQLYDTTNNFRALEGDDLTYALDSACLDLKWQPVPRAGEYSFQNGDCVIFTTRQGVQALRQSLVSTSNDRWEGMQPSAAGRSAMYDGKAVVRVEGLETAELYADYGAGSPGTDLVTTGGCTEGGFRSGAAVAGAITGPRFYFINTSWMHSFFHADKFFRQSEVDKLQTRPDTYFTVLENYRNLHPRRLQAHGIVYPSADIAGVTYTA